MAILKNLFDKADPLETKAGALVGFSQSRFSVRKFRCPATKVIFMLGTLLCSGTGFASPFALPSQDTPNFYNARMCRDHQVLSAILTAALQILKTKVTVAGSDGPKTGVRSDDIRLEGVSILSDDKSAIFCSVTISAKGTTERVLYSVGPTGTPGSYGDSWIVKFGGDYGPSGGGHKLFPKMIQAEQVPHGQSD